MPIQVILKQIEPRKWEAFANVDNSPIVRSTSCHKALKNFSRKMRRAKDINWSLEAKGSPAKGSTKDLLSICADASILDAHDQEIVSADEVDAAEEETVAEEKKAKKTSSSAKKKEEAAPVKKKAVASGTKKKDASKSKAR